MEFKGIESKKISLAFYGCGCFKEPGKALYSFENNSDYVYEASWSPIHPALFASIDGTGRLDLWNLINDAEVPISTVNIDAALNKIRWTNNGLQIAVGDDQGKISIYDVNENYAQPRADDWTKFVRVLQDLKQNTSELDESIIGTPSTSITTSTASTPNVIGGGGPTPLQQADTLVARSTSTNYSVTPNMVTLPSIKSEPNLLSSPNAQISLLAQMKSATITPK